VAVAAEPAFRRQQDGLGQRRGDDGVEGVAAGPHHLSSCRSGERCCGAHDTTLATAGAPLGHHVPL
jgi:hypothetical protein